MKCSYRLFSIVAVLGLSLSPFSARAGEVLVSNLDRLVSGSSPSIIDPANNWAQQFTSGVSTDLLSIKASLGELDSGNNQDFALTAQLFAVGSSSLNPDQGALVGDVDFRVMRSRPVAAFLRTSNLTPPARSVSTPVSFTGLSCPVLQATDPARSRGNSRTRPLLPAPACFPITHSLIKLRGRRGPTVHS